LSGQGAMNTRNAAAAGAPDPQWRGGARQGIIEQQFRMGTQQRY